MDKEKSLKPVIPAQAGIHLSTPVDARLHGHDTIT
jgi:hypothetical protein